MSAPSLPRRWHLLALGTLCATPLMLASSHREAPLIAEMPRVDATDFYLFNSYEAGREDYVTVIANYLPLQDPYGGPNYFRLDPEARYEILLDNDGDAIEDISFRFSFENTLHDTKLMVGPPGEQKEVSIPLSQVGPVVAGDDSGLNVTESYRLELIQGPVGQAAAQPVPNLTTGGLDFTKPVDNIGGKSLPDYAAYADQFVYDIGLPGGLVGRVFVGQRKDPFVVNLGEVFDLVNLDPLGPPDGATDDLADKNVTSLILELPKAFLRGDPSNAIVAGYTAASLPTQSVFTFPPTFEQPTVGSARRRTRVSRLGMPLVNEVVIGLPDKNRFNASFPVDDGQFADYVTHPTLPELLEILFAVPAPDLFPREDLVAVFLTGVDGLNRNGSVCEMQRLNMDVPAVPAASQQPLGVLGGDLAGFPNGRRPGDDVVDAALRVVMGALLDREVAPVGDLPFTDGAFIDATRFDEAFPYLVTPLPGAAGSR